MELQVNSVYMVMPFTAESMADSFSCTHTYERNSVQNYIPSFSTPFIRELPFKYLSNANVCCSHATEMRIRRTSRIDDSSHWFCARCHAQILMAAHIQLSHILLLLLLPLLLLMSHRHNMASFGSYEIKFRYRLIWLWLLDSDNYFPMA